jgi:surface carbohydrate biosynthesis protein
MNIYLPIEIKIRELEGRSLLAFAAAERGHTVILGKKQNTTGLARKGDLQPGIIHDKSLTPALSKINKLSHLKESGFVVTSQDEEHGIAVLSYRNFGITRFSEDTLQHTGKVFCWGQHDEEFLQETFPRYREKYSATGSPRVDLWRPEFENYYQQASIHKGTQFKKEHGDYILISSNFGRILNFKRFWTSIDELRISGYFDRGEKEFDRYEVHAWQYRLLGSFIRVIRKLSTTYPDLNIVVRPHPTDSFQAWDKLIGDYENVVVTREGTIDSWIRHATALIHNGCTSGLEAAVTKTPAIALRSIPADHEKMVPNLVSLQAHSESEAVEMVGNIRKQQAIPAEIVNKPETDALLNNRFSNLKDKFAFEQILDHWESFDCDRLNRKNDWSALKKIQLKNKTKQNLKNLLWFVKGAGRKTDKANKSDYKFSHLEKKELEVILCGYQKALGTFHGISIEEFGKDTFLISKPR